MATKIILTITMMQFVNILILAEIHVKRLQRSFMKITKLVTHLCKFYQTSISKFSCILGPMIGRVKVMITSLSNKIKLSKQITNLGWWSVRQWALQKLYFESCNYVQLYFLSRYNHRPIKTESNQFIRQQENVSN